MYELPIITTTNNEVKKIRALIYFYIKNNGNTTTVLEDANDIHVIVKEEVYIKSLVDSSSESDRTVNSINNISNDTPYGIVVMEDITTSLNDIINNFISRFNKSSDFARKFTLTFQNPNEFVDYKLSEDLIINIFETFNVVEIDLGSYNTPMLIPSRQFKNDAVIFKNCSLQVESAEFFGKNGVVIQNCIFNRKNLEKQNYITFSSNVSVTTSFITIQSVVYIRCNVKTDNEVTYNASYIESHDTTINTDDVTTSLTKDAIIGVSGARKITVDNLNVACDIPGYRIVSIDSCENFVVSDYTHKRINKAFTQDFIISKFMEGVFIDVNIEGPTQYSQDKSSYAILCKEMRIEGKLKLNNVNIHRYGLIVCSFNNFNELSLIKCNIDNTSNTINFANSNIRKIILNGTNIKSTGSIEIPSTEFKLIDSKLIFDSDFSLTIGVSSNMNDSTINCDMFELYVRENSSTNLKNVTITAKSSISIESKRPASTTTSSEIVSLNNVKFNASLVSIKRLLKLICDTVSIYKVNKTEISDLSLLFSDFAFDYASLQQSIFINSCNMSNTRFKFNNVPPKYKVSFNKCNGNALFAYYNDTNTICRQELNIESSKLSIEADDVYGTNLISLSCKNSVGSKFIATEELSISPDTNCDDKNLFSKAEVLDSIDNASILYGVIVEKDE